MSGAGWRHAACKRNCTDVPGQPGRRMKAPGAKQPHPHGREQAPYYERCAVLNVAAAAAVLHRNVSDYTKVQTIEVSFSMC